MTNRNYPGLRLRARPLDPSARYVIRNTATGEYFRCRASEGLGAPLQPVFTPYPEVAPRLSRRFAENLCARCLTDDPTLQLTIEEV